MGKVDYNDILTHFAEDLEKEINFSVLAEVYSDMGWTYVEFAPFDYSRRPPLIAAWVKKYCRGRYENFGNKYLFERVEDASQAILKWK